MSKISTDAGVSIVLADIGITEEDASEILTTFDRAIRDGYDRDGVAGIVELLKQDRIGDLPAAEAFLRGFVLGAVYIEKLGKKMDEFFDAGRRKEK
jgi:uncharacterized membrane protein (Fun14 family)